MDDTITLDDPHTMPTRYWHRLEDGRVQCDVCPRACRLHKGQRGLCFVRARVDDQIVLTSYGRSNGFCLDPVEKNRSTTSCPAAVSCRSALRAATLPAGSVRTGTSPGRGKSTLWQTSRLRRPLRAPPRLWAAA